MLPVKLVLVFRKTVFGEGEFPRKEDDTPLCQTIVSGTV